MQICLLQRRAVVDPEPHSFFGSRRGKIKKLQQKKARGIVNTSTVIFVLKCIQTNFFTTVGAIQPIFHFVSSGSHTDSHVCLN